MNNQKGFAPILVLLTIIAATLVIGVGYYIYDSRSLAKNQAVSTPQEKTDAAEDNAAKDPTEGWKSYDSTYFSLKYPAEWISMKNSENCPDYFGRGATEGSQGICQSDAASQISVISSSDAVGSYLPSAEYSADIIKTNVTVDGVAADRYTYVSKGTEFSGFKDKGTKFVNYIFTKNSRTYVASYNDGNGKFKDVLQAFDTMMTKTFQIKQ
jgi:hypothetical protein